MILSPSTLKHVYRILRINYGPECFENVIGKLEIQCSLKKFGGIEIKSVIV